MKRITQRMRAYWEAFGPDRFDRKALWRFFQGQYVHSGGRDAFPNEDFVQWAGVHRFPWIEDAPGPRGGEGWRLSSNVVALFKAEQRQRHDRYRVACDLVDAVDVRHGSLEVFERTYGRGDYVIHWIFQPPVSVPGPDVGGRQRKHNDPFVGAVPYSTSPEDFAQRVEKWCTHVEGLMVAQEKRLRADAERLAALVSTIKQT